MKAAIFRLLEFVQSVMMMERLLRVERIISLTMMIRIIVNKRKLTFLNLQQCHQSLQMMRKKTKNKHNVQEQVDEFDLDKKCIIVVLSLRQQ